MKAQFEIGTEYTNRNGQVCKVTDIWRTYNLKGECVRLRYVTEHSLMGQSIVDCDVLEITIARALNQSVTH